MEEEKRNAVVGDLYAIRAAMSLISENFDKLMNEGDQAFRLTLCLNGGEVIRRIGCSTGSGGAHVCVRRIFKYYRSNIRHCHFERYEKPAKRVRLSERIPRWSVLAL